MSLSSYTLKGLPQNLSALGRSLSRQACALCLALLPLTLTTTASAAPHHYPAEPRFYTSISACAAFQKEDHTWSDSYKVELGYYDGWHLGGVVRGFRGRSDDLFAVFFWQPNVPVIVYLQNRAGFTNAATVVKDAEGNNWRISRSWKQCDRNF